MKDSVGISLSTAAKILSDFASVDNGASLAMRAYLKLAAVSFDDLVLLHKCLKGTKRSRSSGLFADSKRRRNMGETIDEMNESDGDGRLNKNDKSRIDAMVNVGVVLNLESKSRAQNHRGVVEKIENRESRKRKSKKIHDAGFDDSGNEKGSGDTMVGWSILEGEKQIVRNNEARFQSNGPICGISQVSVPLCLHLSDQLRTPYVAKSKKLNACLYLVKHGSA
ncbi:hypothetical protein AKJ16_DCAP11564 [Drosera capensis]